VNEAGPENDFPLISTAADPRLDDFRDLMARDSLGPHSPVVIGEGVNVVERALRSPYRIRTVVGVRAKLATLEPALRQHGVPSFELDKWVLSEVVGFRVTRGVLVSVDRPPPVPAADVIAGARSLLVLERINDFENLGSVFRNAAAFGVQAILLDERCADPLYRRSVRVSMGHVFGVPFATLPDPWLDALNGLKREGFTLLALTPRPSARPLREVVIPAHWALLLGAEGPGLLDQTLWLADQNVRIPMSAGVDSLNVATAAAVALSHLAG
jgi:tRNA G18 (ribose-2'-O)-methylase SpoU